MDCVFSFVSKKSLSTHDHIIFLIISSRSFIVLPFIFMPVIYFMLIFVKVQDLCVNSFFSACECLVVPAPFLKKKRKLSLFHLIALLLCQSSIDYVFMGLFLASLSCSIDLIICSFTGTTWSYFLCLYSNS